MTDLTYTDEAGNKLYGFSQADMERYNKRLEIQAKWLKALVALGYLGFVYLLIMTAYIIKNNVINNIVARCV